MCNSPVLLQKSPAVGKVINAGLYQARYGQNYPFHDHTCWEVIYHRVGQIRTRTEGIDYPMRPGTVLVLPPGLPHSDVADQDYTNLYIWLALEQAPDWPRTFEDDDERTLGSIAWMIVREWNGTWERRAEMLDSLFTQLDIALQRAATPGMISTASQIVLAAEQIMELRYAEPLTIAGIAREIGISVSALRHHFTRLRGHSPLATLHEVRIRRALNLLRTTNLTLEAIARYCGFDSASHLSHHIRKHTGTTPGKFRIVSLTMPPSGSKF